MGCSKFDKRLIKQYARQRPGLENPDGWATVAFRTGEWDDDIQEYFEAANRIAKREAARAERLLSQENDSESKFVTAIVAVELAMSVDSISLAEAIERLRAVSPPSEVIAESDTWAALLNEIKMNLASADSFETWFKPVRFEGIDHEKQLIRLDAPNQAVRDWIKVNYSNLLERLLGADGLAGYSIYWTISGVNPAFQNVDEEFVQRVIAYFVNERGCEFNQTTAA